jgi:proteasome lid subunit RPN8/RPN11
MPCEIAIPADLLSQIIRHCEHDWPREACGLVAGRGNVGMLVFPLHNERASETQFFAAESLFVPFRHMRERGLDLTAIYHSHPRSLPIPSRDDRIQNYYPDTPQLIVSLASKPIMVQAWKYAAEWVEPVRLVTT